MGCGSSKEAPASPAPEDRPKPQPKLVDVADDAKPGPVEEAPPVQPVPPPKPEVAVMVREGVACQAGACGCCVVTVSCGWGGSRLCLLVCSGDVGGGVVVENGHYPPGLPAPAC